MATTSQLRGQWAPHCQGPWARVDLNGAGKVTVRASIVDAVRALNAVLIAFAYLTRAADTGAFNCRKITGGTGYSLHAFGIAIDLNWLTNPYGKKLITDMPIKMIEAIEAIRTKSGKQVWRWGGRYSGNKDAMHFEIICSPADIASGINPATVPGWGAPTPAPSDGVDWDAVARWTAAVKARAAEILPFIQGSPNVNNRTPYSWHVIRWQQAYNLVAGAGLVEDGMYRAGTTKACTNFQRFLGIKGDPAGASHEHTRWVMCVALQNLAAGK